MRRPIGVVLGVVFLSGALFAGGFLKKLRRAAASTASKVSQTAGNMEKTAQQAVATVAPDDTQVFGKAFVDGVMGLKDLPKDFKSNVVGPIFTTLDENGRGMLKNALNDSAAFLQEALNDLRDPKAAGERLLLAMMAAHEKELYAAVTIEAALLQPVTPPALPAGLAYDQVSWLCSHNAFSTYEDAYIPYGQQVCNIEKQLQLGARAFMLDTYLSKGSIVMAHGSLDLDPWQRPIAYTTRKNAPMSYGQVLATFKKFLDDHPDQIVTLILEDYVKDAVPFRKAYTDAGLLPYIYSPTMHKADKGWPTLGQMIKDKHRLVIFVDNPSSQADDLAFNQWSVMVENQYGTLDVSKACQERKDSESVKDVRTLLLLNWFDDEPQKETVDLVKGITWTNPGSIASGISKVMGALGKGLADISAKAHEKTNDSDLKAFLDTWLKSGFNGKYAHRYPNFIALDFVSEGNPLTHINAINEAAAKGNAADMFGPMPDTRPRPR